MMCKAVLLLIPLVWAGIVPSAYAQSWSADRADGHAPLGVMGDHVHEAGEWMVSVR